jgi:hypothetical protein
MAYDSTGPGAHIPVKRIKPITADWIGDANGTGTNPNLQGYLDLRRRYRGNVANVAALPSSNLVNGDWVLVLDDGSGSPAIKVYDLASTSWKSISSGGTAGVDGAYVLVSPTSTNVYPLPYSKLNEKVFLGGIPQVQGTDYTLDGAGNFSFVGGQPASNLDVLVTCSTTYTASSAGGGAMSTPVIVAADAGTSNATYTLPGSGLNEWVFKGGAVQVLGTDYTKSSGKITFVAGNIPATSPSEPVIISCSIAPMLGTDAVTLGGHASTYFKPVDTVVKQTGLASNHTMAAWEAFLLTLTGPTTNKVVVPAASTAGQQVTIKDVGNSFGAYNVQVIPSGTDTIEGDTSGMLMNQSRMSITLMSDGVGGWWLI